MSLEVNSQPVVAGATYLMCKLKLKLTFNTLYTNAGMQSRCGKNHLRCYTRNGESHYKFFALVVVYALGPTSEVLSLGLHSARFSI